jgi:hypothetical protein
MKSNRLPLHASGVNPKPGAFHGAAAPARDKQPPS